LIDSFTEYDAPEPQPEETKSPSLLNRFAKFLLDLLQMLIITLVLYLVIDAVIGRVQVESISMLNTIEPGELIMVSKLAYRQNDFRRGDIVVFHSPQTPGEDFIKRVIGLPGDEILVENGRVYINGIAYEEPYIRAEPLYTGTWQVPPDSLFVLGDNRNQSSDSHEWGFVPTENVFGRALMIYWPPTQMKVLQRTNPVAASAP
jgi:signal peptidase I